MYTYKFNLKKIGIYFLFLFGPILIGCTNVSVQLVDNCKILHHAFLSITYYRTVICVSDTIYTELHELPVTTFLEENTTSVDE